MVFPNCKAVTDFNVSPLALKFKAVVRLAKFKLGSAVTLTVPLPPPRIGSYIKKIFLHNFTI